MDSIVKCLNIVIAEGMETNEQPGCLQRLGCDFAKGYHFGQTAPFVLEEIKAGHTLI